MTEPGDGGDATSSSAARSRRRQEPTAVQRALGLLTRREHSRKELLRKLEQRGVAVDAARAAVDQLDAAGWQSEARFAASLLRSRAASGYGPAHIRAEMALHGLGAELVAVAMEGFEGDWIANAYDLLRRRHPQALVGNLPARRKAMELLLRRGFSMVQADAALEMAGGSVG